MFFLVFLFFFVFVFCSMTTNKNGLIIFLQSLERLALYVSTLHVSALRYTGRYSALRYTMVARQRLALYTPHYMSAPCAIQNS